MTRSRFTPLVGSLWVAVGFIAVRVFWRLVSDGFDAAALGQAAWAALPFAALIVGCGLASSLIDFRRMLVGASRLRLGGSIALALVIGVSVVLELARSAASVRRAQRLRGSRRASAFIVPLLEHAIERALALAAALDVRGFGSKHPASATEHGIRLEHVSVNYGERTVLDSVTLRLDPGLVVLTGPTGGGKTTLLETIAGLTEHFHGATRTGELTVCGVDRTTNVRDTAALVGYLPQNPQLAFIGDTVDLAEPHSGRTDRREIADLSAGEAVRLALATVLEGNQPVLLLDEPFADLDAVARRELVSMIQSAVDAGRIVVVAEHRTRELAECAPRWLSVFDGRVLEGRWHPPPLAHSRMTEAVGADVAVRIAPVQMSYRGQTTVTDVHADLQVGELVAVLGPNGAGKSSLLTALAQPAAGTVWVHGRDAHGRRPRPHLVALVPENARELFICETLAEELTAADRIADASPGLTELTLRSLLRSTDIDELLGSHPRDLSAGTQRALAIALQLSHKPGLLLVDEPTRGLDPGARSDMVEVLRCVAESGTVVLFATHDEAFTEALTANRWTMQAGRVSTSPAAPLNERVHSSGRPSTAASPPLGNQVTPVPERSRGARVSTSPAAALTEQGWQVEQ